MKTNLLIVLFFVLFISAFVAADIGPGPIFSFTISNAEEYPEYDFYYAGNIWPDMLDPVTEETNVYKLNTHINVFAFPKGEDPVRESGLGLKSQAIDLQSGHTVFKVTSFDEEAMQIELATEEQMPDTVPIDPITDYLLAVGGLLVIAGIAIFFVIKAKK